MNRLMPFGGRSRMVRVRDASPTAAGHLRSFASQDSVYV
jgi:hypothetical protein